VLTYHAYWFKGVDPASKVGISFWSAHFQGFCDRPPARESHFLSSFALQTVLSPTTRYSDYLACCLKPYLARSRLTTSGTRQNFRLSSPRQFPLQMRIVETWREQETQKCRARREIPCTPCRMCQGEGKVSLQWRRSPRAREFFPKRPSLRLMNRSAASGYEHPSASKSKPSANTSGEPSYPCTTSTHIRMLLSSISGSFEQTPYLLKPSEIKGNLSRSMPHQPRLRQNAQNVTRVCFRCLELEKWFNSIIIFFGVKGP
jgi:hypothetical protein